MINRIKRICQRAWNKMSQMPRTCKQKVVGACRRAENFARRKMSSLKHKTWSYNTYAEYVERWTKEITEYCNQKNITPNAENFSIIKKDTKRNFLKKRKCKFLRYLLKLTWKTFRNFCKIILPIIILFLLSPFGGDEGLAKMIATEMVNNEATRNLYIEMAIGISGLLLWWLFFKENIVSAITDQTDKEMREAALEELKFELYVRTKNNNNTFH